MNIFKRLFGVAQEEKVPTKEELQAENSKNFDILKYDGVRALKTQRYDYAIECFRHALDINEDLEIHDYMSQAYLALSDLPNAYQHLQKLAEAQTDNINIFIRMAHVAYMMEDYSIMGTACEKALLIDKESPDALHLYAKSCVGIGDVTNAVALLTKAVTVKPDYADAYLLRGEVLLKEERYDEADEDASWLLENYPGNEDVLMLKANIENSRSNDAVAMEYLDKVIDANPFRQEAYALRGELRRKAGDEAGAKEDIDYAATLQEEPLEAGGENVEKKVKDAYANINPFGL
ncbi:tetratricopeptide repeat protein [uncultured Prevotella sp.]|uniref:tetratricopeptide repeat protein n=1 Tax=uncultured Prevotella sp. TaxID=159272 RepID=UPI0026119211|nr:tetratricopeptide repeat protein [uncultured Prevotella sp.]